MQKFNNFYIHTSEFLEAEWKVLFHYSFDKNQYFCETISLSSDFNQRTDTNKSTIESILFHVSIAFWISYYKLFPTQNIIIDSGVIDTYQSTFWRNFYIQWLWEYFYTNNIDFRKLCNFKSTGDNNILKIEFPLSEKMLLPIWWGKDSIVSSYLLGKENTSSTPFIFGKSDSIKDDFLEFYWQQALMIKRQLDPKLFEMNQQWYYNWHVPITGLISFFMTFVCYIYDYKHIAFSNEKSADIGNTHFHDAQVNHQYSKGQDFEKDFTQYIAKYISEDISYFSVLRDMYEIEIAQLFAQHCKKYFSVFSSCNKNFSITKKNTQKWCNSCPKCLFVYIILRPFLSVDETMEIFWEELFENPELKKLFLEIIGATWIKPFECIWEIEEAQLWCHMSLEKFSWQKTPYLLEIFQKHHSETNFNILRKKYNI